MELLTFKITPLSSFSTIPKGDTIFGQILSYLFSKGDNTFENYLEEEPKLIVSDMMPYGYVYKPVLPLDCFAEEDKEVDKKDLRKKEFITLENLQNGDLSSCEKVDYQTVNSIIKNKIDRTTFTTGGDDFSPYSTIETTYTTKLWLFILVEEKIKEKVVNTLKEIGHFGFGKDGNIGKGIFDIEKIETPIKQFDSEFHMSISPTILSGQKFSDVWYEPFVRFGKYGLDNIYGNYLKKPVLMVNSAMVIKGKLHKSYFGTCLNNGYENKPSFLQGYSITIPFKIKDEKCLNIE